MRCFFCVISFVSVPVGICDINSSILSSLKSTPTVLKNKNRKKGYPIRRLTDEKLHLNIWIWSEKVLVDKYISVNYCLAKTNKLLFGSFSMRLINCWIPIFILLESRLMPEIVYDIQLNIDQSFYSSVYRQKVSCN